MKKIDKDLMATAYVEMGELNVSISEGITEEIVWKKEVEKDGNRKRGNTIYATSPMY